MSKTQEEIDKLDAALTAGQESLPIQGAPFTFHNVDYLEVEVLKLPVTGLSVDFLWRFSKPVATILNIEPLKLSHSLTQINQKTYEERLKDEVLSEWKRMLAENTQADDIDDPKAKAMINKWHNISEVKVHYLKLVRDE